MVVPIHDREDATREAVGIIERLPSRHDDIAAAIGRDGPNGARVVLKTIVPEMRQQIFD